MMETNNRRTGKTFRAILKALLSVSEGNNTVFVSRTIDTARNNFMIATRMIESYSGSKVADYRDYAITIEGFTLAFVSKNYSPPTHRDLTKIEDLD